MGSPSHNQQRSPQPNVTTATGKGGSKSQQSIAKLFAQYDMVETSYHLYTGRVDLHMCDDSAPGRCAEDVTA